MVPEISIVIVNWNTKLHLIKCLKSIKLQNINIQVIVVDNGSTDGSQEAIKKTFPWVKLIEIGENVGFPKGNNIGIKQSDGKYVLLLNPDTKLSEGNLEEMYRFMEENSEVGMATCRINYPDGRIQYEAGRNFPSLSMFLFEAFYLHMLFPKNKVFNKRLIGNWDHNSSREVPCISGAYMFIRKKVIDEIGLLDDAIFMYFEDIDYCYRTKVGGWKIFYYNDNSIIHCSGAARKKSEMDFRGNQVDVPYRFFLKHHSLSEANYFRIIYLLNCLVKIVISLVLQPIKFINKDFLDNTSLFKYRLYFKKIHYIITKEVIIAS